MDKEQARFILRCYRPEGADADDQEFAAALKLAAADRELGEWLAKERASDAAFSTALASIELPEGLREEILAGLAAERGDLPMAEDGDLPMIKALAALPVPADLRGEILQAMAKSAPPAGRRAGGNWWRFALPLAAAAGVAVAFIFNEQGPAGGERIAAGQGLAVPVSYVQETAMATLQSPEFKLDLRNPDHQVLFDFLQSQGSKCPQGVLPPGLETVPGIGCRTLAVDGKPGAIVCFKRSEHEVVHVVVFSRDDVDGPLPGRANPEVAQHGEWAVARWEEKGRVIMVMGVTRHENLRHLF